MASADLSGRATLTAEQWSWLLWGDQGQLSPESLQALAEWYTHCPRISLAAISQQTNFPAVLQEMVQHRQALRRMPDRALAADGERNLSALAIMAGLASEVEV